MENHPLIAHNMCDSRKFATIVATGEQYRGAAMSARKPLIRVNGVEDSI